MRARLARVLASGTILVALASAAAGCSSPEPRTEAERAARAQALIDDGNAAYRQGDFRTAVRRYAAAAVVRKDDAAAYYGMGMALSELGRDEEARAAYARARELSGGAGGALPGPHPGRAANPHARPNAKAPDSLGARHP